MTTKTATVRAPSPRRTSLAGLAVRTEHCPHVAGRLSGRGLDLPAADPTVAPTDRVVAVIAAAAAVADTARRGNDPRTAQRRLAGARAYPRSGQCSGEGFGGLGSGAGHG